MTDRIPEKDLLRPDEVAAYFSLSVKTVYGWIDQGKLDAVKIGQGRLLRVKREALNRMIQSLAS